jgi:WD40 repeat protein
MLLENSGEYLGFIQSSPMNGFRIQCIIPYNKGFIIGGESGEIIAYEKIDDLRHPYVKRKVIQIKLDPNQTIT